jgi:hypothetical protein
MPQSSSPIPIVFLVAVVILNVAFAAYIWGIPRL